MNIKGGFKVSTGVSSLLMIFVVLALTTFSVLGFVTANSDYKLAVKTAQGVTQYYDADMDAETFLAMMDQELYGYMEQVRSIEQTRQVPGNGFPEDVTAKLQQVVSSGASGADFCQKAYAAIIGSYSKLSQGFYSGWNAPHC